MDSSIGVFFYDNLFYKYVDRISFASNLFWKYNTFDMKTSLFNRVFFEIRAMYDNNQTS